jgi:hypothetical protein
MTKVFNNNLIDILFRSAQFFVFFASSMVNPKELRYRKERREIHAEVRRDCFRIGFDLKNFIPLSNQRTYPYYFK